MRNDFSQEMNGVAVVLVAFAVIVWCPNASSAEATPALLGDEQRNALHQALEGEWICDLGNARIQFVLSGDNQYTLNNQKGHYSIAGATLSLNSGSSQTGYDFELGPGQLTLSGGDLTQPLRFTRLPGFGEPQKWLSALSVKSLREKGFHLLLIVLFVIVCRLALFLFGTGIRMLIYSNWGPMRFVYRHHKNRYMTIYSLGLNIAKYAVYLLALGYALSELGVNYTAYFASLSVIGLAIGFGSQGLVQDMVTGFFIVFEDQFNVGDMVEIAPYVGRVEELGLRMTRLRHYLGQTVIIPNRNIAAVGNFSRGAQEAQIDVAIANREAVPDAKALLLLVANEISSQFAGILVSKPTILPESSLATGEHFVHVRLGIWPQQHWVVEQQMLPRIREAFGRKGIEIPHDRVIAFYHPRDEAAIGAKRRKKRIQAPAAGCDSGAQSQERK